MRRVAVLTATVAMAAMISFTGLKAAEKAEAGASAPNIVQVAESAGSFTTLLTALKATGLDKALEGKGPFTVFAPTDAAFAKLPPGTVEALLKDLPKLKAILLYHVVSGDVTSAQVVKLKSAKTLEGSDLMITVDAKGVKVDGANVVKTDIPASNGVIHVIDTVVLPAN